MRSFTFQRRTLAQQVADRLIEMIDRDNLMERRRFPAVREVAQQLGVSSQTANSAIRLLAEKGIVRVHPRKGTFIQKPVNICASISHELL